MQIWAESGKSALPICNYSQILYQFLTFTQNLKRSQKNRCNQHIYWCYSDFTFLKLSKTELYNILKTCTSNCKIFACILEIFRLE